MSHNTQRILFYYFILFYFILLRICFLVSGGGNKYIFSPPPTTHSLDQYIHIYFLYYIGATANPPRVGRTVVLATPHPSVPRSNHGAPDASDLGRLRDAQSLDLDKPCGIYVCTYKRSSQQEGRMMSKGHARSLQLSEKSTTYMATT